MYRTLCSGESTTKGCIAKMMLATIHKSVEMHYSGSGHRVNGQGKKDFSATRMFGSLQGINDNFSFSYFAVEY